MTTWIHRAPAESITLAVEWKGLYRFDAYARSTPFHHYSRRAPAAAAAGRDDHRKRDKWSRFAFRVPTDARGCPRAT